MRRPEAAKFLGVSLPKMTRLQDKNRLHPVTEEGINFYDPDELAELKGELEREKIQLKTPEGRREAMAEYQLNVVKDVIGLVKEPREKIDAIQFDIIKDLRAENARLTALLAATAKEVEQAKDTTLERNMAMEIAKSESKIKETAAIRMVNTIGALIGGQKGVQLNADQLEQLILANADGGEPFLTPEQEKQAKAIVAEAKAKSNGKGVVAGVANTVKNTTEQASQ